MISIILFLKSHVAGYTRRDGTYVKPHEREGGAAASPEAGQLALFAAPPKMEPGQVPAGVAHEPPAAPVTVTSRKRIRDPLDGSYTELTLSNGKVARIQRMSSGSTMGLPGWHDLDGGQYSYLDDTEGGAIKELLRRHNVAS